MKKKWFKTAASLAAALVLAATAMLPAAAAEQEIPELGLTVELPDGMILLTQDLNSMTQAASVGVTDVAERLQFYQENNVYLEAFAPDHSYSVIFSKKENEATYDLYDLAQAGEEAAQSIMDEMAASFDEGGITDYTLEVYEAGGRPYVYMFYTMEENGVQQYELSYTTVVNGYSLAMNSYGEGEPTQAQRDAVREIVDSAQMEATEKPESSPYSSVIAVLIMFVPLVLIFGIVLVPVLYNRHHQKTLKKVRAAMSERLDVYHKAQQEKERKAEEAGVPLEQPPVLFKNRTEISDAAIRDFCHFHCIWKRIYGLAAILLLGLGCIVLSVVLGTDFLSRILLLALGVVCVVYPLYLPYKMTRNTQFAYRKIPNRTAIYLFRPEDFRVSGIQSTSTYPYFQITRAYESKGYFYLYFGDEHAYYVKKSEFNQGTPEEFRELLKQQLGKNYKRRFIL